MARTETISVSMRELDRLKTIQAVIDKDMKQGVAAARLGITPRQLRRLVQRYAEEGPAGLASRHRGRPSNRQLPSGLEAQAVALIREHYADFGPTLAAEKLAQRHGLHIAKETVRRIMMTAGFWVPRKLRPPKVHQPRHRRACLGELVQIDGCEHHWFEDRAPMCTLLVYVDDATSRLMQLLFVHSESTFSYFTATRAYLEQHGKPIAFYSDKASIFRVNHKNAQGNGQTQFARALYELNIDGICANTSQAKGRVERAHLTLQDRLVKELRLRGISTLDDANAFAADFIDDYNARFAKAPRHSVDAHRLIRADENLDLIFTWRSPRCVSDSLTVRYDKKLLLLEASPSVRLLSGKYIEVYHYPDNRVEARYNGTSLPYSVFDRLAEVDQLAIVENKRLGHALQMAKALQDKRDNRRSQSGPTIDGTPRRRGRPPGTKSVRAITELDLHESLIRDRPQS